MKLAPDRDSEEHHQQDGDHGRDHALAGLVPLQVLTLPATPPRDPEADQSILDRLRRPPCFVLAGAFTAIVDGTAAPRRASSAEEPELVAPGSLGRWSESS